MVLDKTCQFLLHSSYMFYGKVILFDSTCKPEFVNGIDWKVENKEAPDKCNNSFLVECFGMPVFEHENSIINIEVCSKERNKKTQKSKS